MKSTKSVSTSADPDKTSQQTNQIILKTPAKLKSSNPKNVGGDDKKVFVLRLHFEVSANNSSSSDSEEKDLEPSM